MGKGKGLKGSSKFFAQKQTLGRNLDRHATIVGCRQLAVAIVAWRDETDLKTMTQRYDRVDLCIRNETNNRASKSRDARNGQKAHTNARATLDYHWLNEGVLGLIT